MVFNLLRHSMKASHLLIAFFAFVLWTAGFSSCTSDKAPLESADSPADPHLLRLQGDSISQLAQQTLLMKVVQGLQTEGAPKTIDFCQANAGSLLDSMSTYHKVHISRISDRNRNPNQAASVNEMEILAHFAKGNNDTLVSNGNQNVYYKAIRIGMPGCLLCHGVPGKDIQQATLDKISVHYPNDKAINYQSGDLRGAWKLVFED